ncbi:MAG: RluA family pseudouridine synthase [Actinomycetota bacterium]|nr:RluA family pseudouridine synthase [Actinomycetota bacterium]
MIEVVPAALAGERVDRVVALLTGMTRSQVATLVEEGAVRLDQTPVRTRSHRVAAGETLEVPDAPAPGTVPLQPEPDVTFAVVYADKAVIVVDKPAGLVVHPGAGQARGTLVGGLLARFPDLAALAEGGAEYRPGIVHRLDKGTSGLLVVARTAAARQSMVAQLASRSAERRYQALVWGRVEANEGLIDAPIRRAESDPTRMAIRSGGREARTRYRVDRRFDAPVPTTLLECRLETGRTHQIRVHLSAIGHPVVGDARYRRQGRWPGGMPRLAPDRVWLHAACLSFDHPTTGMRRTFTSPLPGDLAGMLDHLSAA